MKITSSLLILLSLLCSNAAHAQAPQKLDLEEIKSKYKNLSENTEVRVVQNRLHTQRGNLEIGGFFGFMSSDPFLDTNGYGATLNLGFTEMFGIELGYMKVNASLSAAHDTLLETTSANGETQYALVNYPDWKFFAGPTFSPLYGKLSFIGEYILYYDLRFMAGAAVHAMELKRHYGVALGVTQEMHITKSLSARIDYRVFPFKEDIPSRNTTNGELDTSGSFVGSRNNITSIFTMGLSYQIPLWD